MRKDLIYPIAAVIATAGLAGCGHGKVADKQDGCAKHIIQTGLGN